MTFDTEDLDNEATALAQTANLKLDFDRTDTAFWFNQFEMHLATAGIKKQWTKRLLLLKMLPKDVVDETKDLLRKGQAEAGATPYKDLKDRVLETFGTIPEDAFTQAEALVMTGKPSTLARQLINILCPSHPNLTGCCARGIISAMWRKKLPQVVRNQVAGMPMDGEASLKATLKRADDVWVTSKGALPGLAVAAVDLDTSADAPALQQPVAAVRRNAQARKRAGTAAPVSTSGKPNSRGDPSPDGPPPEACSLHWRYGRSAYRCRKPESCPWVNIIAPKPKPQAQ